MSEKILITPKSYGRYKDKAYPMIEAEGYEIIENTTGRTLAPQEIIELASDAVGIIVGVDAINQDVLLSCKKLKAVSKYGVGMDNIDLDKAKELGINVKNALGSNTISVAELAIALLMDISRNIKYSAASVGQGGWDRLMGREITGKKLGVIGGGQIGREVAKRGAGLFMDVSVYDPYITDFSFLNEYNVRHTTDITDIFKESDYISLHIPATDSTKAIINEHALSMMKQSAYIINTSRGELVDEEALYNALSGGVIAGYAADVFSSEPPLKDERLLKLDNFVLTAHIGAFTHESVEKMVTISTKNLLEMLKT